MRPDNDPRRLRYWFSVDEIVKGDYNPANDQSYDRETQAVH